MAYQLTEEQKMIQAMVRDFAREEILPTAQERDRTGEFPAENLRKMGDLGLMGMNAPPEYNGAGVDTVSYSLALQEVAYACASTAAVMSVHNSVACGPIYLFGSEYLKETYLKPLAAGRKIGSFALTEPGAGSDPSSQKTKSERDGDSYIINGTKIFITTGKNSDLTVVTAYTDMGKKHRGISAFVVEKGTPGFTLGKVEEKMGLKASDTVELIFEDCRVPQENLLGREGDGFIIAMTSLDGGRIGIASQSVGLAQACLDAAISYAKERIQFGRPISQFQGIRWMIADMATQIEAARLLLTPEARHKHLKAFKISIDPKSDHKGISYQHLGEEFIYVLEGKIEVMVGENKNILGPNKCLHFNSSIVHKLRNLSDQNAELLVILYTP